MGINAPGKAKKVVLQFTNNGNRDPYSKQPLFMRKIALFIVLDLILVTYSLVRFPAAGLLNALPVLVVLVVYGLSMGWAWNRLEPPVRYWGILMGMIAGAVLGAEVILEYILLPANNTAFGLIEYSLFLLLMVLSGILAIREQSTLKGSLQAGLWTGMVGSLIWYGMVLLVFHLFFGSTQQAQVFRAEGNMEDFARSGGTDFTLFIVQDFFGAGFFHLLLGAIIGAIAGFIGGISGRTITRLSYRFRKAKRYKST